VTPLGLINKQILCEAYSLPTVPLRRHFIFFLKKNWFLCYLQANVMSSFRIIFPARTCPRACPAPILYYRWRKSQVIPSKSQHPFLDSNFTSKKTWSRSLILKLLLKYSSPYSIFKFFSLITTLVFRCAANWNLCNAMTTLLICYRKASCSRYK